MSKKVSGWPLIAPAEINTEVTGEQIMDALAADVEASDNRKVLTAAYGGLEGEETGSVMWASPLPIIGEGDAGKVLTVNAGETRAEWAEPSGGVPVIQITQGQSGFELITPFEDVVASGANRVATVQMVVGGNVMQTFANMDVTLAGTSDNRTVYLDKIEAKGIYTSPDSVKLQIVRFTITSESVLAQMASATVEATIQG